MTLGTPTAGDPLSGAVPALAGQGVGAAVGAPHVAGEVAREVAQIRLAMEFALARPRDPVGSKVELLEECTRPTLAAKARYSFPRGGADVVGPSVNLARVFARCWGNIQYGYSVLSETDGHVHLHAFGWDVETNARVQAESRVAKRIQRKVGRGENRKTVWVTPDERDLLELVNRIGAKLVRNCILQLAPPDLIDEAMRTAATAVAAAASEELSDEDRRARYIAGIVSVFDNQGVTRAQLDAWCAENIGAGSTLDGLTSAAAAELRAIAKSLLDGNSKAGEHFAAEPAQAGDPKAEGKPRTLEDVMGAGATESEAPADGPGPIPPDETHPGDHRNTVNPDGDLAGDSPW